MAWVCPTHAFTKIVIEQDGAVISGQTFDNTMLVVTANHVRIIGNTWKNVCLDASPKDYCRGLLFKGVSHGLAMNNVVLSGRGSIFRSSGSTNVEFRGNDISNIACAQTAEPSDQFRWLAEGIKVGGSKGPHEGRNIRVIGNRIHDFPDCPRRGPGGGGAVGIYCDTGPSFGKVFGNVISNIATKSRGPGISVNAIYIEARCHDWVVSGNVIDRIGKTGIRNASPGNSNQKATYIGNTITNVGETAFWGAGAGQMLMQNNVMACYGSAAVRQSFSTITRRGNHYGDPSKPALIGRQGTQSVQQFEPGASSGAHSSIGAGCENLGEPIDIPVGGEGFPPPVNLRGHASL
jgi:hypothetical protein